MLSFFPHLLIIAAIGQAVGSEPGLYCAMNALTPKERKQLPKILERLIKAEPAVRELSNGYELSFHASNGLFPLATEWLSMECRCCPFFDFQLSAERYGGPMVVRITGPDGVKAFIADDLPTLHRLTEVAR